MIKANIREAKARLSELLERAHKGEAVVIVKAGRPYVRLVPVSETGKRQPGAFRGRITGDVFDGLGPDDSAWG